MPLLPNHVQAHVAVSSEMVDPDSRSLYEFSDGEPTLITNGGMMKKYKSADDLETGLSPGWFISINYPGDADWKH